MAVAARANPIFPQGVIVKFRHSKPGENQVEINKKDIHLATTVNGKILKKYSMSGLRQTIAVMRRWWPCRLAGVRTEVIRPVAEAEAGEVAEVGR